jgi:hypothetical protein
MKSIKLVLLASFLMLGSMASYGKVVKLSGDLSPLKGITALNLQYDYSKIIVGGMDEETFIKKGVEERNAKKPGSGDVWKERWVNDRDSRFAPRFEELLNKYVGEKNVAATRNNSTAKYTLILKTVFTETGFNIGIMRRPAFINVEIDIVETANHSNVLAKLSMSKIPGRDASGYDFETGSRLEEAYAKCGKDLGKFLLDKAL